MNRKDIYIAILYVLALFVLVLFAGAPAHATLGGSQDTIAADRLVLKAVHRATTSHAAYTVHEAVADALTVREYVSPDGIVFAVTWHGYNHPDLKPLLGSYWTEFSEKHQKTPRKYGHKRMHIATDNIVVEKWGHMRDLAGRAFLPGLIPNGVNANEIN